MVAALTRRAGLRLILQHMRRLRNRLGNRHDNPFATQILTAGDTDEGEPSEIIRCLLRVIVNASISFIRRVWRATAAAAHARRTANR